MSYAHLRACSFTAFMDLRHLQAANCGLVKLCRYFVTLFSEGTEVYLLFHGRKYPGLCANPRFIVKWWSYLGALPDPCTS